MSQSAADITCDRALVLAMDAAGTVRVIYTLGAKQSVFMGCAYYPGDGWGRPLLWPREAVLGWVWRLGPKTGIKSFFSC
jgi:hypothetical protein